MMVPAAPDMRSGSTVLAFAIVLTVALLPAPISAGGAPSGPGCCICEGCTSGPATQCFVLSDDQCQLQCSQLNCAEFIDTAIGCPSQPACTPFQPPAPAPALAPVGLAAAVLGLAAIARRVMRR
ncbi:MAG: hypothetical protein SF182_12630 [Deltaproteobacteria bacterium]|nr:hypothetical protein [Deltaproteobacteria bacterium]